MDGWMDGTQGGDIQIHHGWMGHKKDNGNHCDSHLIGIRVQFKHHPNVLNWT